MKSILRESQVVLRGILEDQIPGGKGDDMSPQDVADKHGVDVKDIEKQIEIGIEIELEHTPDKSKSLEIVMDHLEEFAD